MASATIAWAFPFTIFCCFVSLSHQIYEDKYGNEEELMDSFSEWLRRVEASKGLTGEGFDGQWLQDTTWPKKDLTLGQIAGVSVDKEGNPVVFHRADRPWKYDTFFDNNTYTGKKDEPNPDPTLVKLNKDSGEVLESWGDNLFYLPHGLEIDQEGNYWVTDVALHQVFKMSPQKEVVMSLGTAFEPASDNDDPERFCKPADVAVASNGDFFVADGYCNSRIIKYSKDGQVLGMIGQGDTWVPHSLALVEDLDLICVADRENKRILCYKAGILDPENVGYPDRAYENDSIMGKVYAITYSRQTGYLYAVSAPTDDLPSTGLTIELRGDSPNVVAMWNPKEESFSLPHDLEVTNDGKALYVGEIEPHKMWKFQQGEEIDEKENE